jgi:hypothetical protein
MTSRSFGEIPGRGLPSRSPQADNCKSMGRLWFAKTPAGREINNIAWCHLTTVLL